jgi:hypothetical protein
MINQQTPDNHLKEIYLSKPFQEINADKIDLINILDLFVEPAKGLSNPFDYKDAIIKGCRGSGKTMYLRANHAYYLYSLVPALLAHEPLIIPVYIKLNDFQHLKDPAIIYREFILKVIKELMQVHTNLRDAKKLAGIHQGLKTFSEDFFSSHNKNHVLFSDIRRLSSEEYTEKISKEFSVDAKAKYSFLEASAKFSKENFIEIKQKPSPSIIDVEETYDFLLRDSESRILLLLDEASSINKSVFRETEEQDSVFEIIMNQLRTRDFLKTKIAVYPHSYSDILVESCYGEIVKLQEDITSKEGYNSFREKCVALINKYLSHAMKRECNAFDLFFTHLTEENGTDTLEQIINTSNGNIRRFLKLAEQTMEIAYSINKGLYKVFVSYAFDALRKNVSELEDCFDDLDKEFLYSIKDICKSRKTYIFQCPNKAPVLLKFTNKSTEHNIITIKKPGTGSRGTIYSFDYAFCVKHDIPTHYIKDDKDKIDINRSRATGEWISKVTNITEDQMKNITENKFEGIIENVKDGHGTISGSDNNTYYWISEYIMDDKKINNIKVGQKVLFFPMKLEDSLLAMSIELV